MGYRIRALAAAAVVLVALAGCASGTKGTNRGDISGSGSCAAVLRYRGHTYEGSSLRTHPPFTYVARIDATHLHVIGAGQFPPCQDTNHSTDDAAQSVRVARIDGVDPATAVAVLPHGDVFVNSPSLAVIKSVLKSARGIRWDYSS